MRHVICFVSALFAFQVCAQPKSNQAPFVLGEVTEVNSKILGEQRTLNIYLPEGYHSQDSIQYPVIYLLDGAADEDFIHVVGLVQFNSFEWVDRLPKSIVVGIANVDRTRDFTFPTHVENDKIKFPTAGGSADFIAFMEQELQPFVKKKYRTTDEQWLIGQSLGGLLATEILFNHSDLFEHYVIVSPSLWWDNASLLEAAPSTLAAHATEKIEVYLGVGKEGITPSDPPRVMEVDANLLADKIHRLNNANVSIYFDYLPDENHATILHQAVANAFKLMGRR